MAFLDVSTATCITLYACVIVFAFPFAGLAKMRKLQQQTSAPTRLSARPFLVSFLWLQARRLLDGCAA